MKIRSKQKIIIGRKDVADFPGIHLDGIQVKIDTGAYTSSINCYSVKEIEAGGGNHLFCKFLSPKHPDHAKKEVVFKTYKQKKVKSSNGLSENRYLIKTEIKIFNKLLPIELTLTKRNSMKNDVLLGRKFLKLGFLVDVKKSNLSQKGIIITI